VPLERNTSNDEMAAEQSFEPELPFRRKISKVGDGRRVMKHRWTKPSSPREEETFDLAGNQPFFDVISCLLSSI
jgi:hypothetical protein